MKVLNNILRNKNALVDIHIHTNFSDGVSPMEEIVTEALKKGLKYIAFTDHVWQTSDWVRDYAASIRKLRAKYSQINILTGLEAKAVNFEGKVDVKEADIEKVDFVMGVVHRFVPEEEKLPNDLTKVDARKAAELETHLILKMLENEKVDIIGHPMRTYYKFHYGKTTKEQFPEKLILEIIKRAKKLGKPIEYNIKLPLKNHLLELLLDNDAPFLLGTDSHSREEFGAINHKKEFAQIKN